jgi:carboxylesterase 2/para-nitrobenzyl esterase
MLLASVAGLRVGELIANPDPAFWAEVALSTLPWGPTVDGHTLPMLPIEAIRAGAGADVDLMAGSNTEEALLFLLSDGFIDRITNESRP